MPSPAKRSDAVILRMFGIGDALLFRMVLEKYAEAVNMPPSQVTVLGSTSWAPAAKLFFHDVETVLIDERKFAKSFLYRLTIMHKLRRRGFYIAICGMRFRFPHVIESLILASGAPNRIVAAARPNEKFDAMFAHYEPKMTKVVALTEPERPRAGDGTPLPLMHEIEHQLAFLSAVAGHPITLPSLPSLKFPEGTPPLMHTGERYAVLNIGASHEPRRWPLKHFLAVALRLLEQGYSVVLLGGPSETGVQDELEAQLPGNRKESGARLVISINELDFAKATRLVARAALVVSNDSGLGHLALMLNRPSVLIVGGGHFGSFMPYPQHLTPQTTRFLYQLLPCYHCNWNCTMMPPGGKTFPCVSEVSVEQALTAIKELGA